MNKDELNNILQQHKLWAENGRKKGCRANLAGENLRDADLRDADLRGANLTGADLTGADLTGADLKDANLSFADLVGANLTGTNLQGANLIGANLSGANLQYANLSGANLHGADLKGANLPVKNLETGKLYELSGQLIDEKTKKWVTLTKSLVCLISVNQDETLDFIEAGTGIIYRNAPSWLKYSFTLSIRTDMLDS